MHKGPVLLAPTHHWYCPNCGKEDTTHEVRPHVRLHTCPKLGMLTAPMLPKGQKAKVVAVEREDYVGNEQVRKDSEGRTIMSVVTTRDDGQDAIVFAPTAHLRAK